MQGLVFIGFQRVVEFHRGLAQAVVIDVWALVRLC